MSSFSSSCRTMLALLALAACLAYATSSARSALDALGTVRGALLPGDAAEATDAADQALLQGSVVLLFHATQAALNLFAALVVLHRLWLQSNEDERAWLVVRQRISPRVSRADLLGRDASSMV